MSGPAESRQIRVGIIDSGLAAADPCAMRVVAARCFMKAGAGAAFDHGAVIARIILADNPGVDLLIAQVFGGSRKCSTAQVAAALDWLVGSGAAVVNMSFGIRQPDTLLRLACERATAAGALLVGSAPARGAPVFPAAYPFCIAVSGDARCAETQISWLGTAAIDFGAHPFVVAGDPHQGGASFAAARITGRIAALLRHGTAVPALRAALQAQCSYRGPERKGADAAVPISPMCAPNEQPA